MDVEFQRKCVCKIQQNFIFLAIASKSHRTIIFNQQLSNHSSVHILHNIKVLLIEKLSYALRSIHKHQEQLISLVYTKFPKYSF